MHYCWFSHSAGQSAGAARQEVEVRDRKEDHDLLAGQVRARHEVRTLPQKRLP
jgi:hypothetical protein